MKKELMFQRCVSKDSDYEYIGHHFVDENTFANQPDLSETMNKVIDLLKSVNVHKFTAFIINYDTPASQDKE